MCINMHLLRSLRNQRNLFGIGLGVYWAILLVISFRAHAGNELGNMEMMKKVGGQSSPSWCNPNLSNCATQACPLACPAGRAGLPCNTPTGAYSDNPDLCSTASGNEYCTGGDNVQAACQDIYACTCDDAQLCNKAKTKTSTNCTTTSSNCSYEPCPN